MRRIVRGVIYVACTLAGALCICQPVLNVAESGHMEVRPMLGWFTIGFIMVFLGCELNDVLKKYDKEAEKDGQQSDM